MSTLEQLEQRIAALESRPAGGDQLTPNVLTIAADGSIGAELTGHVHAAGLDLDAYIYNFAGRAAKPSDVPTTDRVDWLRVDNGGLVAMIAGLSGTEQGVARDKLFAFAKPYQAGRAALMHSGVANENGDLQAYVQAARGADGTSSSVNVSAGPTGAKLLDQDRASDFAQLRNVQVFQNSGPLPVSWVVDITSPTALIVVFGSGYLGGGASGGGFPVDWDGLQIAGITHFFNNVGVHHEMHPGVARLDALAAGAHTLSVFASGGNIVSDVSDLFTAVVIN